MKLLINKKSIIILSLTFDSTDYGFIHLLLTHVYANSNYPPPLYALFNITEIGKEYGVWTPPPHPVRT